MELRAYFFQNFYLHGIHAGIQSQHTTAEMFVKYQQHSFCPKKASLYVWAKKYKTTIVLNGGMQRDLIEILSLLESNDNPYPFSYFKEAQHSLNGVLTNVGIILPECIYNYNKKYEEAAKVAINTKELACIFKWTLTPWEEKLVEVLSSKRLMN